MNKLLPLLLLTPIASGSMGVFNTPPIREGPKEISEIVARDYQLIGHINSTPERVPIMVYKRREGL